MMGRLNRNQEQFFYSFRLDEAVPDDHPVREIAAVLDLNWVHSELAPYYPKLGRPSIDPVLMIRMLIVGYVFAIRSERALCRDVRVNLAYRWFCGLSIEDQIPDHSAFSRARNERFRDSDIFRSVFERVVGACIGAGLVGGEGFAVDASLIVADANKQRSTPGSQWSRELDGQAVSRATKEYLATLDDAAFGAASEVTPKFISPSDPAAQWTGATRGPAFFAYSDNYLIDVKFGIIMDVEASRAIRQAEVDAAKTMIERTESRFDIKPEWLAGDTAYGSGASLNCWSTRPRSRRISQWSTSRSARMGPSVGKTSPSTRGGTFTFVRPARFSQRRVSWSMMGRPFSISREHATVVAAHSRHSAAQRLLSAESSEASTRRPVTWHGRWPKPKHSSDRVAIANVLRCCLHISSVSFGSVVCACVDHVVLSSSSHWRQSRKTSAGSQSSSSDHRRSHKWALHNERRVRWQSSRTIPH